MSQMQYINVLNTNYVINSNLFTESPYFQSKGVGGIGKKINTVLKEVNIDWSMNSSDIKNIAVAALSTYPKYVFTSQDELAVENFVALKIFLLMPLDKIENDKIKEAINNFKQAAAAMPTTSKVAYRGEKLGFWEKLTRQMMILSNSNLSDDQLLIAFKDILKDIKQLGDADGTI